MSSWKRSESRASWIRDSDGLEVPDEEMQISQGSRHGIFPTLYYSSQIEDLKNQQKIAKIYEDHKKAIEEKKKTKKPRLEQILDECE